MDVASLRRYCRITGGRLDVPDTDQPRQRDLGDLQLVVPAQDQSHRVDEHLRDQRTRRQLAHPDPALEGEEPADHQDRAEHRHMRDVDDREEDRPQPERVPLPCRPFLDPAVRQLDAAPAQAVRLDGAAGVDRLGQDGGDGGVTGGLRAIGGRRALEVPAAPHHQQRNGDQHGGGERRGGHGEPGEQQRRPHHTDGQLRHGLTHGVGEPVDVGGDAGQQVARPGPLQDARRQPDRPHEEVLAQIGQHALAEHRAAQPHLPDEHGLDDQRDDEQGGGGLQMEFARVVRDPFDDRAQQIGPGHRGHDGHGVDGDQEQEGPAVPLEQFGHVGAYGRGRADGQRVRRRRGGRVVRRWRHADHAVSSISSSTPSRTASSSTLTPPRAACAAASAAASSSVSRVTTAR